MSRDPVQALEGRSLFPSPSPPPFFFSLLLTHSYLQPLLRGPLRALVGRVPREPLDELGLAAVDLELLHGLPLLLRVQRVAAAGGRPPRRAPGLVRAAAVPAYRRVGGHDHVAADQQGRDAPLELGDGGLVGIAPSCWELGGVLDEV